MKIKLYEYKNCSTCQKALKFLESEKIAFDRIAIVDQPPSLVEIKQMLEHIKKNGGSLKNLLNTSGQQYRELKIAEQLKSGLSEHNLLKLLSENGKLVKRPFLLAKNLGLVGFKVDEWTRALKNHE